MTAAASLKLSLQENFYDQGKHPRPMAGLSWYQPLIMNTALNSWAGYGDEPFELKDDVHWFSAKSQMDFIFGSFVVSPGMQYKYIEPYQSDRLYPYIRVDWKIFN